MGKITFFAALIALSLTSCRQTSEKNDNKKDEIWELVNFIDDYREPTKHTFIRMFCDGYIKNGQTELGKIEASLLIDKLNVRIQIHEFKKQPNKNYNEPFVRKVPVYVKQGYQEEINIGEAEIAKFEDGFYSILTSSAKEKLMNLLSTGGKISFHIRIDGNIYYFTFPNTSGLEDVLNKTIIPEIEPIDSVA